MPGETQPYHEPAEENPDITPLQLVREEPESAGVEDERTRLMNEAREPFAERIKYAKMQIETEERQNDFWNKQAAADNKELLAKLLGEAEAAAQAAGALYDEQHAQERDQTA